MHDQVTGLVKRPATLYNVIWLFTSMRAGVYGQTTRLMKRLAILYTLIWFFHLCEYGGAWSGDQAG